MARGKKYKPNPALSAKIKLLRLALVPKMSQEKFAEEIGVDVNTYRNYESGKHGIPESKLEIIADKLKCCPECLYKIANGVADSEE